MGEDQFGEADACSRRGQCGDCCTATRRGGRIFWPVHVELARPGGVCVWVEVTAIATALVEKRLDETFDMDPASLLAVVMEPITFGRLEAPVGEHLAAAAHLAGTTPSALLLCLLASEAVAPTRNNPRRS